MRKARVLGLLPLLVFAVACTTPGGTWNETLEIRPAEGPGAVFFSA